MNCVQNEFRDLDTILYIIKVAIFLLKRKVVALRYFSKCLIIHDNIPIFRDVVF